MKYTNVKEFRIFYSFHPIHVSGEALKGPADGVNKTFYTVNKPLVDFDYDGEVVDDVAVFVNGAQASISSVDAETGAITLSTAPSSGATIMANYYWHPFGDSEVKQVVEQAENEVDLAAGRSFESATVIERVHMTLGQFVQLSRLPIQAVNNVKIVSMSGEVVAALSSDDYVVMNTGLWLKKYRAGMPSPPWYIPAEFFVEVEYVGGYATIPNHVKHATLTIAGYRLLLKVAQQLSVEPEYQGKVSVALKSPSDLEKRLETLSREVADVKHSLSLRAAVI
ncbi:MAG: hypothetical protein QXF97_08250 [Candidatus Caldarchaeum sp.]